MMTKEQALVEVGLAAKLLARTSHMDLSADVVLVLSNSLKKSLHDLWKLRAGASDEFNMIVNFIQTALSDPEINTLSDLQCRALYEAIRLHLKPDATGDDVQTVNDILSTTGLDPLRAFAGWREEE